MGAIYRQFSITIVAAMTLSVLVALVLTPALCATILKQGHGPAKKGPLGLFNRVYDGSSVVYQRMVEAFIRWRRAVMVGFLLLTGAAGVLFVQMPTGFLPEEDQGQIMVQVQLPPGSTMERTRAVMERVNEYFAQEEHEAVDATMTISGFAFSGRGQNSGIAFVRLRPWDERRDPRLSAAAVVQRASAEFARLKEAVIFAVVPPAIRELGNATGFEFQLQDRGGLGHDALIDARNRLLAAAAEEPALIKVRQGGLEDTAQYEIEVDQEKAAALGLSLSDINRTLATAFGGTYVNDFIDRGRTKRVYVQGDAPFRMLPGDIDNWYVRSRTGEMVPFSAFATGYWTYGSPKLDRFGGFPSILIQGEAAPGYSSGEAMAALELLASELPEGIGFEWSGLSYEERASGAGAISLYALSLLVVFLCLAALYESWSIPLSVMLVVPLGVLGASAATLVFDLANDVYFQVGLLTTVGLSAKNAILIVEFAKDLREQGLGRVEAALAAAKTRLRPVLMTSMAFILGVLPLAISTGVGAGAQNAIGIAVIGGVTAGTFLGVLLIPVFYVVIARR